MRLGIASILVGLVGAYGVRHMMEEEEPPVEETTERVVQVPLASGSLPVGRRIRMGDIGLVAMTEKQMNEKGWNPGEIMMIPDEIIGRELKRPLSPQSPFRISDVHLDGYDAPIQPRPGMRAVPIRVAEDRGGGQAMHGDTVDLFFTSKPQRAMDGKPAIPEKTLQVGSAVRVLDIDYPSLSEVHWAVGYKAKSPIFTLEVDPETAGKVTTLKDYGDFAMLVRSSDEPGGDGDGSEYSVLDLLGIEEPVPPQQPPVWAVEKYQGRSRNVQYFPLPQPTPQQLAAAQQPQRAPPREPVQEVLPDAPARTPSARVEKPNPQIPYRSSPSPSVQSPTPATPSYDPPAPPASRGSSSDNPFKDDPGPAFGAGEVIP